MKLRSLLLALSLLLCTSLLLHAQPNQQNWLFGHHAGITFASGAPMPLGGGATDLWEGTSVWSDSISGALVFYTDGRTVWDRSHKVVNNGTGLNGGASSTQTLIIPRPGSDTRFFVITAGQVESGGMSSNGVQYSEVDLAADTGRGRVTSKNIPLLRPATEKMVAIRQCNGIDFWLIVHQYGTDSFMVYPITSGGIGTPVVSAVGPIISVLNGGSGYLSPSANGRRLAMVTYTMKETTLFDFDNATGRVSRPLGIAADAGDYGACFSPDGSRLYISDAIGGTVRQYDISSGDSATIAASRVVLHTGGKNNEFGALQRAPDGRIYMAKTDASTLDVIANPNALGTACDYRSKSYSLAPATSGLGLPSFAVLAPLSDSIAVEAGSDLRLCRGSSAQLSASGADTYEWFPATGLSCTNCPSPVATPSVTTTYRVRGTVAGGCAAVDSVTITVVDCSDTGGGQLWLMPDLCLGQTQSVDVPYFHRDYTDTVVAITITGADADLLRVETLPPFQLVPGEMHYIRVTQRWRRPSEQRVVMTLTTSGGGSYRIDLISRVGGTLRTSFDVSTIHTGPVTTRRDTCITITNTTGAALYLRDTAWSRGGRYRLNSPTLPRTVGNGERLQLCLTIDPSGGPAGDTLFLALDGRDSCNAYFCIAHPLAFDSLSGGVPSAGVTWSENGAGSFLSVEPSMGTGSFAVVTRQETGGYSAIRVLAVSGELVAELPALRYEAGSHRRELDLSGLAAGTYFVLVEQPEGWFGARVTVRR